MVYNKIDPDLLETRKQGLALLLLKNWYKQDENVHRFVFRAIRGELLEREKETG